jgi:carbamoyltransferase
MQFAGLRPEDIEHIAVSVDPWRHIGKRVAYALKLGMGSKEFLKSEFLRPYFHQHSFWQWYEKLWASASSKPRVHFIDHHHSHIAGSFFVSPYDKAALLSLDGSGEWSTHWMGEFDGKQFIKYSRAFSLTRWVPSTRPRPSSAASSRTTMKGRRWGWHPSAIPIRFSM